MNQLIERIRGLCITLVPSGPIRSLLKAVYWGLPFPVRRLDPAADMLTTLDRTRHPVTFLQIGANDGADCDFLSEKIRRSNWKGLLLEPHPNTFKRLLNTYRECANVRCLNVAISSEDGEKELFYLCDNSLVASFDPDHVEKFSSSEELQSTVVRCCSMSTLLKEYPLPSIDLLAIDTEGHDSIIIESINFEDIPVDVILFESLHLSSSQRDSCENKLRDAGYRLVPGPYDCVAIHSRVASGAFKKYLANAAKQGIGSSLQSNA